MGVSHWDEVEWHHRAKGEMDARWQQLGDVAGSVEVGLNRVRVEPGKLPTPPHSHGASEETYLVLAGSGLAWQDGEVHEVRPLDCVVHRADELELRPSPRKERDGETREEIEIRAGHVVARPPGTGYSHSFVAGPEGATMLVYGTRKPNEVTWYPRSQKINFAGLGVIARIETFDYYDGEPED